MLELLPHVNNLSYLDVAEPETVYAVQTVLHARLAMRRLYNNVHDKLVGAHKRSGDTTWTLMFIV